MLEIYFDRKFSGFITAVSAFLVVAGGIGLTRAGSSFPLPVRVVSWLVLVVLSRGIIVGVRQLRKPPLMYKVDRRGVMIYYDADRIRFSGDGVFLPWSVVKEITLEERRCSGAMSKRSRVWVVACTVEGSLPFPVSKHSVAYLPHDREQVVCLDAFTGTVSRQDMLRKLRSLWAGGQMGGAVG